MTCNFNDKLGEGGFGSVFEGKLSDGTKIAVKRLNGFDHVKKSFLAEVETIGSIHHVNLPEEDMHLLSLFKRKAEEEQLLNIVDKYNDDKQIHREEVVKTMRVAVWCLQSDFSRRPSMSVVVKVLEGSVEVENNLDYNFTTPVVQRAIRVAGNEEDAVGKSVFGMNFTELGNLVLFDQNNATVWQSFDHPTDSLLGQTLFCGQKLTSNKSASNLTPSLFSFDVQDYYEMVVAYVESNPPLPYFKSYVGVKYVKFEKESFLGRKIPFASSWLPRFIRLDHDGHLKAYQWDEWNWNWNWNVTADLMTSDIGDCSYPMKQESEDFDELFVDQVPGMPTIFSYEELRAMTSNFNDKLEKGGFGRPSMSVVVKVLKGSVDVQSNLDYNFTTPVAPRPITVAGHQGDAIGLPISLAMAALPVESVQCFSRKKTVVVVTYCKHGRGLIKINGCLVDLVEPEILRYKAYEPNLLLYRQRFADVDMRIRVKGGGHTSQIYAIRGARRCRAVATPPRSTPSEALAVVSKPDGRVVVLGAGEEKAEVLPHSRTLVSYSFILDSDIYGDNLGLAEITSASRPRHVAPRLTHRRHLGHVLEFSIPVDVHLRLAGENDSIMPDENLMSFPVVAFIECGLSSSPAPKGLSQVLFPQQGLEEATRSASAQAESSFASELHLDLQVGTSRRPREEEKQFSPSATTPPTASSSQPDKGSTSDPAEQPSTSAPCLIPPSQRQRCRRTIIPAEMGRKKAVVEDLLADIPDTVNAQSARPSLN
ncbi:hypothetical protein HYC85_015160 [Camellia sinensis]|uniref:Serine-threonine/tyrosine-protein kinase catalytic domain-containing protein n=1 Tax=Camellia sinensis TaxID=4442 RepID=A0A7J7H8D4_CAMSI|nr:hypothetical protein HYC85_015160 [Camellia sinensis]